MKLTLTTDEGIVIAVYEDVQDMEEWNGHMITQDGETLSLSIRENIRVIQQHQADEHNLSDKERSKT